MLTVFMLRHGETAWNADNNRYCGRTDIELTSKGKEQAQAVRQQLQTVQFDAVYSSPLKRAFETATIASGMHVVRDRRLIEADFGNWEGRTRAQFMTEFPGSWEKWEADPAANRAGVIGETGQEIVQRVDDFFGEMLRKHHAGKIMVVAHNGVNRLFLAYKLGMPLRNYRQLVQQNSSLTSFTLDDQGVLTLEMLNSKF